MQSMQFLSEDTCCVSHFYAAVKRQHDQGNLEKKRLIDTPSPIRLHLPILPKLFSNWVLNIQMYESLWGAILI